MPCWRILLSSQGTSFRLLQVHGVHGDAVGIPDDCILLDGMLMCFPDSMLLMIPRRLTSSALVSHPVHSGHHRSQAMAMIAASADFGLVQFEQDIVLVVEPFDEAKVIDYAIVASSTLPPCHRIHEFEPYRAHC